MKSGNNDLMLELNHVVISHQNSYENNIFEHDTLEHLLELDVIGK